MLLAHRHIPGQVGGRAFLFDAAVATRPATQTLGPSTYFFNYYQEGENKVVIVFRAPAKEGTKPGMSESMTYCLRSLVVENSPSK